VLGLGRAVGGSGGHYSVCHGATAPALHADGAGVAGGPVPPAPPPCIATGAGIL
jgi:hypothetical protein